MLSKTCDYFEERNFPSSATNTFLLQVPQNLILTAEKFILISEHLYVKEHNHMLHENSIKHKNAQLSYLNRQRALLPPQTSKTTATKEIFTKKG